MKHRHDLAMKLRRRAPSRLEELMSLHLRAAGIPEPEREYRFAPPRRFRFDFAWPALMLACECEGATFSGGRHTRGKGFQKDCEKYNLAVLGGWSVLRFDAQMIQSGEALATIEKALDETPK